MIDDREEFKEEWERRGGIFILHTSTLDTLRQLHAKGVIEWDEEWQSDDGNTDGTTTENGNLDELDDRPDTP